MKKKAGVLAVIFLVLVAAAAGVIAISKNTGRQSDEKKIVASFYPVYVIAENLCDGIDGVSISNMTPNQTGCLHDYQMTTEDMKKLEDADIFVLNGGGMETFVEKVVSEMPGLTLLYTDEGVDMLESDEEEGEYNAHAWLEPSRYKKQAENMAKGLADADPANKEKYFENLDKYTAKIDEVAKEYENFFAGKENRRNTIIFHEAFEYLSLFAPIDVLSAVEVEGDNSALSAGELAEVVDTGNSQNIDFIIVEEQYRLSIADRIAEETGADVLVLDSLVTGDGSKDAWINGMKDNLDKLKKYF
ncbi:MAG: zinc ABC transporter substrate-binding protein [Lachnospiraceae bacterium]|nr:zinc ABC transporter substrate-binding protein [Lachnospiraceae bacterium]